MLSLKPRAILLLVLGLSATQLRSQAQVVFPRLVGMGVGNVPAESLGTDIHVRSNIAYLAWSCTVSNAGGLEIFSVTNPATPVRIGGYQASAPITAIQLAGPYAFLLQAPTQIA